jgi:hypothetical protein
MGDLISKETVAKTGQSSESVIGSPAMDASGAPTKKKNPWSYVGPTTGYSTNLPDRSSPRIPAWHPTPGWPRYYLAGKMRGEPRFGFDAFDEAAAILRKDGAEVLSPADHDRETGFNPDRVDALDGFDLTAAMRWDLQAILRCDAIVLLPGWETSEGVAIEVFVANAAGIELLVYPTLTPIVVSHPLLKSVGVSADSGAVAESITEEAHRLVSGPRQGAYGHPFHDFTRTGRLMGAIIGELKMGEDLSPRQVALCMEAVKISREVNAPKRDNRVDGVGYWECLDLVDQYEEVNPSVTRENAEIH